MGTRSSTAIIKTLERIRLSVTYVWVSLMSGRNQFAPWRDWRTRSKLGCYLDADNEGLRNERGLIQTIGRAVRASEAPLEAAHENELRLAA